jgi:DNA-binding GntR family transcriptional regulator
VEQEGGESPSDAANQESTVYIRDLIFAIAKKCLGRFSCQSRDSTRYKSTTSQGRNGQARSEVAPLGRIVLSGVPFWLSQIDTTNVQHSSSSLLTDLGHVEKAPTVGDKVYARLEQALMIGEFAPGQRLVTRTVAASMNVSPTPVREALNRLVSSHALQMDDNRVYCVHRLSPQQLDELYRIRFALEGLAASEAARRMDEVTLAKLHAIHAQMAECIEREDHKAALHYNRAFHFALYETAQMPMLNAKIRECWVLIGPYFNLLYPEQARQRTGVNNHQKILEAAAARDPMVLRVRCYERVRRSDRAFGTGSLAR